MPPGMFMDESEVQSSRALEAHSSNIAKQREVTHHIRKAKRGSSGVAQSTGEDTVGSSGVVLPPRGLRANDAANYDSDENSKPQALSDVERRLQERGLSTVFDPVIKPFTSSSVGGGSASSDAGQVSISRLIPMPDVGVGRSKLAFIMRVPDPSVTIRCKIKRTKVGVFTFGKDKKPEYSLYHESDAGDIFMLSARRRKKSKYSNYLLSLDQVDLSRKSPNCVGKVRANMLGTAFSVYDGGVNPDKAGAGAVRHELAAVEYETNVLGTKGPRVMKLYIPSIKPDGSVNSVPQSDSNGLVAQYRAGNALNTAVLINKPPKWSDSLGAYCLNFKGRVTVASVKNFQMCYEDNVEPVLLQFGKTGDDEFTMDYTYPFNALQAFGVVLSSFDSKLACE